jgi:hypothetical protein
MVYRFLTKIPGLFHQYYSPESVLHAAGSIHAELAKIVDFVLSEADSSRQKSKETDAKQKEKHLAMKTGLIELQELTTFLRKYAPLQLLFDRKSPAKLNLSSRKMMHACNFLKAACDLVVHADKSRGVSSVADTLATLISVDKRMPLPHPLWTTKQDAVLIHAIAKHGWIDNDASCRRITKDSDIRWGFPFDAEPISNGMDEGSQKSRRDEVIKDLRGTATRAAQLLNDHHDILEDLKAFNHNLVVRAYSLVHDENEMPDVKDERPRWVVNDNDLLASTGLYSGESQELPTKKDLVKRVKLVLSKNADVTSLKAPTLPQAPLAGDGPENESFTIDQSDTCNVLLAEILKAVVKAPYPKAQKTIRLLCAIATEEATIRKDSILSSSDGEEDHKQGCAQAADEMAEAIKQIELAKQSLKQSARQAKNVLRVLLGIDVVKHVKDPDFPTIRPIAGTGPVRKEYGQAQVATGTKRKKGDSALGKNEPRRLQCNIN